MKLPPVAGASTQAIAASLSGTSLQVDASAPRNKRVLAASTEVRPDELFDWAESTYSQFFPGHVSTQSASPFQYRHYPATGNYVGVDGQNVYVLGPVSGGMLTRVGSLMDFACYLAPSDCPSPPLARPVRRRVADGLADYGWVVSDDGSVLALGNNPPVHPANLTAIPNSLARRISGLDRVVAVANWGAGPNSPSQRAETFGDGATTRGSCRAEPDWPRTSSVPR
jgi:hypothetical protein